jgi:hypothetical protein
VGGNATKKDAEGEVIELKGTANGGIIRPANIFFTGIVFMTANTFLCNHIECGMISTIHFRPVDNSFVNQAIA